MKRHLKWKKEDNEMKFCANLPLLPKTNNKPKINERLPKTNNKTKINESLSRTKN